MPSCFWSWKSLAPFLWNEATLLICIFHVHLVASSGNVELDPKRMANEASKFIVSQTHILAKWMIIFKCWRKRPQIGSFWHNLILCHTPTSGLNKSSLSREWEWHCAQSLWQEVGIIWLGLTAMLPPTMYLWN